jgi:hypothetical protein
MHILKLFSSDLLHIFNVFFFITKVFLLIHFFFLLFMIKAIVVFNDAFQADSLIIYLFLISSFIIIRSFVFFIHPSISFLSEMYFLFLMYVHCFLRFLLIILLIWEILITLERQKRGIFTSLNSQPEFDTI